MKQLSEEQLEQVRQAVNALIEANLKPKPMKRRANTKTIVMSKPRQQIFAEKLCIDEPRVSDIQWTYWLLGAIMRANNIPVRFPVKLKENFKN